MRDNSHNIVSQLDTQLASEKHISLCLRSANTHTHCTVENHDLLHTTCSRANTWSPQACTHPKGESHNYQGRAHANRCGEAHKKKKTVAAICEATSCQIRSRELLTGTLMRKNRARSSAHRLRHISNAEKHLHMKHNKQARTITSTNFFSISASPSCKSVSVLRALSQASSAVKSNLPYLTW